MSATNIQDFKVLTESGLGEIYYVPEFVSESEEEYLLRKVGRAQAILPFPAASSIF